MHFHDPVVRVTVRLGTLLWLIGASAGIVAAATMAGNPDLMGVVKRGDVAAARDMLVKGAKPDVESDGYTPLMIAVQNGDVEMARLLIEHGASVNFKSNLGSPLWLADAGCGKAESSDAAQSLASLLLSASLRTVPNPPGLRAFRQLVTAAVLSDLGVIVERMPVRLFQVYADDSVRGAVRIRCDVAAGNKAEMRVFMDASGRAEDLVSQAPTRSHLPGSRDRDVLLLPPIAPQDEWVGFVVDRIPVEQAQVIRDLVLRSSNVNASYPEIMGGFPLLAASLIGDVDLIRLLLEKGADPNIVAEDGSTPLLLCAHRGHTGCVAALLQKGAKVDAALADGTTPLIVACQNGHTEPARLLLQAGARANIARTGGSTPLHAASWKGYSDLVALLMKNGATANQIDENGDTALTLAQKMGHKAIATLIQIQSAPSGDLLKRLK